MSKLIRLLSVVAALLPLYSGPAQALVWVGTPVGLAPDSVLGEVDAAVSFNQATLQPCGQGQVFNLGSGTVNLEGGTLSMPTGTWCGLVFSGVVVVVEGETALGEALDVEVQALTVNVDVPATVTLSLNTTPPTVLFFAEGWLEDLDLDPADPVFVAPGGPLHGALSQALAWDSAWIAP